MPDYPKITVITPSFNQGQFIERTIQSVLSQGYPRLEFLVIDGGSRDGTVDILRKYAGQLDWTSEKDNGQADAINRGIKRSTGDIIAYLNSDDVYEPGALLRVGAFFRDNPEAMWVTGKCRIIDEQDREMRGAITAYKNCLLRVFSRSLLLVTNPVSQPATFWRRRIHDELGLFNEEEHLVMDYDFWLRICERYPLAVIEGYLAGFRVYPASKTSRSFLTTFRRELVLARRYSNSPVLNALHWMSYVVIASVYVIINFSGRSFRDR